MRIYRKVLQKISAYKDMQYQKLDSLSSILAYVPWERYLVTGEDVRNVTLS